MSKAYAVDFDGTLCENRWPEIGKPNQELIGYLVGRRQQGDKVILWTCRSWEDYAQYTKYRFDLD